MLMAFFQNACVCAEHAGILNFPVYQHLHTCLRNVLGRSRWPLLYRLRYLEIPTSHVVYFLIIPHYCPSGRVVVALWFRVRLIYRIIKTMLKT